MPNLPDLVKSKIPPEVLVARGYFELGEGLCILDTSVEGAILDFTKYTVLALRGYFGIGGGLFWIASH